MTTVERLTHAVMVRWYTHAPVAEAMVRLILNELKIAGDLREHVDIVHAGIVGREAGIKAGTGGIPGAFNAMIGHVLSETRPAGGQ